MTESPRCKCGVGRSEDDARGRAAQVELLSELYVGSLRVGYKGVSMNSDYQTQSTVDVPSGERIDGYNNTVKKLAFVIPTAAIEVAYSVILF